jgi:7-cyano-7-deazaguanine synthase in queuosine biosynthesis
MSAKHVILCGGTKLSARGGAWKSIDPINLALGDGVHDVHLRLHDLTSSMTANLSDVHTDLLEIAAFIYAADQAIRRGGKAEFEYGLKWRRHLWLEIPVRNPDFWMAPGVLNPLREVLTFLSDDDYEFNFTKLKKPPAVDGYLEFRKDDADSGGIEEVMLFSGGLDSFGGAIKEIADGRRKVALVSHEPTTKVGAPQRRVVDALNKQLGGTAPVPFHIQVSLNKGKSLGKEYTQRARSFVYASLAAIVARMLGKSRIRFYENGVVSFNLPLSMQCLGGRASRTTHPQTLAGFSKLFTAIFGCAFTVENPFLWKTKTDIVRGIKASGFGKLCATTISCAHTWERTNAHTHCGTCSQCIDRRMVTLAAGLTADEDPPGMYEADLMTHSWSDPEECTLVERYVGTIKEVKALGTPRAFLTRFPQVAKALRHAGKDPEAIAKAVFDLHQLHATQILDALAGVARDRAQDHVLSGVSTNSLLGMALLRSTSSTAAAPMPAVPVNAKQYDKPTADRNTFTFHYGSGSCQLGNSMEFKLIERLCRSPGVFLDTGKLMEDVWEGRVVQKNTIAKTVCNLRRKLKDTVTGIKIDGGQKDHYCLSTI